MIQFENHQTRLKFKIVIFCSFPVLFLLCTFLVRFVFFLSCSISFLSHLVQIFFFCSVLSFSFLFHLFLIYLFVIHLFMFLINLSPVYFILFWFCFSFVLLLFLFPFFCFFFFSSVLCSVHSFLSFSFQFHVYFHRFSSVFVFISFSPVSSFSVLFLFCPFLSY